MNKESLYTYGEAGRGAVRSSALRGSVVQCRARYDAVRYVGLACGRARGQELGERVRNLWCWLMMGQPAGPK